MMIAVIVTVRFILAIDFMTATKNDAAVITKSITVMVITVPIMQNVIVVAACQHNDCYCRCGCYVYCCVLLTSSLLSSLLLSWLW